MTINRNLSILAQGASSTGVLNVSYGGTGNVTLTAGYIPYGNGTGAFSSSSNLTFSGTNLSITGNSYTLGGDVGFVAGQNQGGGCGLVYNSNGACDIFARSGFSIRFLNYLGGPELARIHSSGGVSIGNTTDPGSGNLSVTGTAKAAGGVLLGSSTTALTDYQQGTWTPVLSDGTNNVNLTGGYYIKVGKLVTLFVNSYNTSMAGLNTASNLRITNLPFAPTQDSVVAWNPSLYVAATIFNLYVSTPNNRIDVYRNATAVDYNGTPLAAFGSPANMSWFFSISYAA